MTICSVVEGVLLFLNLQCEHLSRSALKQLRPSLTVAIDTLTHLSTSDEEAAATSCIFQLRVLAFGLGAYFLDGVAFIKQICHLCPNLRLQSCNEEQPVMEVLCRRTGEPGRVTRYALEGWSGGATQEVEPVIQESMATRPTDLHPAALLVKMVLSYEGDLKDIGKKLGKQLHLMQLLNPEVSLSLLVRDRDKSPIIQVAFETTSIKTSYRPPLLITSDNHYIKKRLDSRLAKLQLFKGDTQTLPDSLLLQDGRKVSLKLFSMVAVLPQLRLKKGKKIPINKLCQKIHIFVYGSHSLPLVLPESQPGFPLSLLADWDCYGLSLSVTSVTDTHHTDDQVAAPSYVCDVTNSRQQSSQPSRHTLIMFLFLEDPSSTEKTQLSDNIRWKQQMEVVHKLRVMLQGLIMSQSRKFHQATHSALNKISCNYGSHSKTKSIMVTALPLLAEAVASIVKHSTEEAFKESCLDTLQVDCVDSVCDSVEQRLWRIAKKKLGITHPTDNTSKNPDEPTTPELAVAVQSDPVVPQIIQDGPSATVATPRADVLVDSSTSLPSRENTDHLPTTRNDTTNSQNTQSLFQARISNKRRTYQERESNKEDSQVTCINDDDTCFDSLCEEDLNFETNSNHISQTENQPSLPIIGGAATLIDVKDLSEYNFRAEIESQLSQPILGATALPVTNWFDRRSSNSEDSDEEISISNFDELENCSDGGSFTECMECESGGDDDMTEYDELGLYYEDGGLCKQINAQTKANSMPIEKEWSIITNESTHFADEGSCTTAALPVHEAGLEQVAGGSASDDEWDNLLTCKSKDSQHTPQASNKADDVMVDELADHAAKNTQETRNRDFYSSSVLDIDVNDFEWD